MSIEILSTTPVSTPDQASTCYALRHRAYVAANAIVPRADGLFHDAYDEQPNCPSFLLCDGDRTLGSRRANIYSAEFDGLPTAAQEVYGDEIKEVLGARPYVESNRFVMDPAYAVPSLDPILILFQRICQQGLEHACDYFITAVRRRHVRFYRRLFLEPISGERIYPGLQAEMVLMAGAVQDVVANLRRDPNYQTYVGA